MGAMTLDTIMIKIESDATGATSGVDKLATSLSNLRNATKGGFNNLQKLGTALQSLNKASSKLSETTAQLDKLSSITTALNQLSSIEKPTGLKHAVDNLSKLPGVMSKITPKNLENITRVSNELADALTPLANKLGEISQGYSAISALADKYGVSVTKVREYTKQTHGRFKALSNAMGAVKKAFSSVSDSSKNFGKAAIKSLGSVHSKIKQVGLSLLGTRTLFTAVRKAVSEYMSMDQELTDSISNAWRALGAQLAPAIEYVIHLFTQFIRVIYSIIKALTGVDLIARANAKAMSSWGKSSKDTLGQLQKFDDLNVVEFDDGKGDNKLIDMEEIDLSPIQWIIDATLKIKEAMKEAFDTGEWHGVGEAFADGFNIAMDKLNFDWIEEKLKTVFTQVGNFINGLIETLNWSRIGELVSEAYTLPYDLGTQLFSTINWGALGTGISNAIASTDFSDMVGSIFDMVSTLTLGIQDAFLNIDFKMVATKISGAIKTMLSKTSDLLGAIKWEELGSAIRDAIINIDWVGIITGIIDVAKQIVSSAGGLFDSLFGTTVFGTIATTINDIINDIALLGATIVETLGEGSGAGTIFSTLEKIIKSISELVGGVAKSLTKWIISEEFQSIVTTIKDVVEWILVFVEDIITSFTEWFNGEGGSALSDTLSILTKILDDLLTGIFAILKVIGDVILWLWKSILLPVITPLIKAINWVLELLSKIISYLVHDFKKDFISVFESIRDKISNVWEKLKSGFASMVNFWIGKFEGFVNAVIGAINWLVRKYNGSLGDFFEWLGFEAKITEISYLSLPRLETGTNNVPYEGIYHLHPGEAVVPKKYNPALGNGGSEETNQKLDTLIYLMENMNFTNVVNVGNETLYKKQQAYNKMQNDKYGTTVNI